MKKKGILKRALLLVLAIMTVMSCAVTAFAGGTYWDGTGTSGGTASSNAKSGYSIAYGTAIQNVVGYRFTAVKSDLSPINSADPVNIFVSMHANMLNSRELCWPMRSKFDYTSYFNKDSSIENAMETSSTDKKSYSHLETDFAFRTALPSAANCSNIATAMETWQALEENTEIIAELVGYENGLSGMRRGDKIIVEPLFAVVLGGNEICCTVTEIAEYGRILLGSNDSIGGAMIDGYFGHISYFTNGRFANVIRTTNQEETELPFLDTTEIADKSRVSFKTLITYGYGVGVLVQKEEDALPDRSVQYIYFTDTNNTHYSNEYLPLNTTIRIWASFYTSESLTSNLYYGLSDSDEMDISLMNFLKSNLSSIGSGTWGTSGSKYAVNINGRKEVLLGTMSSSSAKIGYVHAAIFEPGTTSVTSDTEFNAENNQTEQIYYFTSRTTVNRDLEANYVKLYMPDGTEYPKINDVYQIPYGHNVVVKVYPKNNGDPAWEDADIWWKAKNTNGWTQNKSEFTGSYHQITKYKAVIYTVGNFNAYSTNTQTCTFAINFAGQSVGNATGETDTSNNIATCNWVAVKPNYTLTVDPNGGTWNGSPSRSTFTMQQEATKQIADPTRPGWEFNGWTIDGGGSMNETTKIYTQGSSNCTITAKWTPLEVSYTVKHYLMNTDGSTYTLQETETKNDLLDAPITLSDLAKSYTGFTYSYAQEGSTIKTSTKVSSGMVINLYYSRDKYTVSLTNGTGISGTTGGGSYYHGATVNIDATVKTGYHWKNWTGTYTLGDKKASFTMPIGNVSLTANAVVNTYTVTYYGNGSTSGSTAKSNHTYNVESKLTANGFERTGYYFTGWNTAADGSGTSYSNQQTVMNLTSTNGGNINLYAQWAPNTITFKYYSNYANTLSGNTIDSNQQVHVVDWTVSMDSAFPDNHWNYNAGNAYSLTRTGWTATGYWGTTPDGGILIQQDANFTSYADVCAKYGVDINTQSTTINIYAQWTPNTITFKYYSNYANTLNGNTIDSNQQVHVVDWTVAMNSSFPDNHWNYTATSEYALYRNRWYATGYWGTTPNGGILVQENENFHNYAEICAKYDVDINTPHTTINIYAQWEPHYDVELYDIIFKAYDSNGNLYTLNETQQQNIPIGTTVYVYYTYKNRSPVPVKVTGYNTNGAAISYNGSTKYDIPKSDATLTVPAGSFTATPLGAANMSGSVYINGLDVSDESTDIDNNAKTNNTRTESYHVKFDVEIVDIYLTDYEGNIIDADANIPVNSDVVIHHVYRNNSSEAYTVNGYDNSGNKITYNGTQKFTIPAYGTIDIIAGEMRTPEAVGDFSLTGSVYRDGKTAATEKDEWDLANNILTKKFTTELGPYLTPIAPNAAYREGTDVITSYWLVNPTTNNYTSSNKILVRIKIYDTYSGNLITELAKTTVVPAGETQLVYFKWHVPYLEDYNDIKIIADLDLPEYDYWWGRVSRNYDYGIWSVNYTPDTGYEDKQPSGWTKPGSVADAKGQATWALWEYTDGAFRRREYAIIATGGDLILTPQSETAYQENYMWYMKSGYGFTAEATGAQIDKHGGSLYKMPDTDAYTEAQYAYMYYPEFQYQISSNTIDTMEYADGKWQLFEFLDYGRVHFTPIWYPDGVYDAIMVQSDIWTPMGMITTQKAASVIIEGDMYDDWYVQGQG